MLNNSETKKINPEIEKNVSLFQAIWKNSNVGMRLIDKEGIIIKVNPAFCRIFEKTEDELIGKHFSICYDPLFAEKMHESFVKRFSNRIIPSVLERKQKLWNGKELWVELRNSYIELENGVTLLASLFNDITEQKNSLQKIIEISNKNEALFKSVNEGIHVLDLNGNLIECNQSFADHLGYNLIEMKSMNIVDWDVVFSREELLEILNQIPLNGKIFESRHKTKSGEIRDVEIYANKVTINENTLVFCSSRDITEKKIAEDFIKESEARFKSIFEENPLVMMIVHPETSKIIEINNAACTFYGYSREEFINTLYSYDLNVSSKQDEFRDLWLSKNRKRKQFQAKHKIRNGTIKDVEIYSCPILIREKKLILTVINDITERVIAEEKVKKMSQVIEQSPVSVIITDKDGIIQYVNSFFTKVTGFTEQEAIGRKPSILKSGFTKPEVYDEIWTTITAGKDWFGELLNKKKNGELYWEKTIISPITDNRGKIINFVAIQDDVSEMKKMMDELRFLKEEAEKSDRLKSEFLAQISHEIRTPINVIMNFINYIKEEFTLPDNEDIQLAYSSIDSAGKRIIRTIDLILNMSELQVGSYDVKMKFININSDVLQNLYHEYKVSAEQKGLTFRIILNTNDFKIFADEYSITQVFSNLIDNAIKYTNSGSVDIIVERDEAERMIVKVKDSGIGMSEEYLKNLFQPFSQEDGGYTRKFEGNGLGLALVKKYCSLNNAEIKVESIKGKGSTFSVIFS